MQRAPELLSLVGNAARRAAVLAALRLPRAPLPVAAAIAEAVVVVAEVTLQHPQPEAVVALITKDQ